MFHQSETPTQVINWDPVIQNVCDWEAFLGQWWSSQQGEGPRMAVEGISRAAGRATPTTHSRVSDASSAWDGGISALTRPFYGITGTSAWVTGLRGGLSSSPSDAVSYPYPRINLFPA